MMGGLALFMAAPGCSLDGLVFDVPAEQPVGAGGTGGAAASSSSSAGGAQSSSGVGGAAPLENCVDGIDNDSDGSTDCDDTDCSVIGYTCIPAPPDGWDGPVLVYDGEPDKEPVCPPEYPDLAFKGSSGLVAGKPECTACSCTAPGLFCDFPDVTAYSDDACAENLNATFSDLTGTPCGAVSVVSAGSFDAPKATAVVNGCKPSGGAPDNTDPFWIGTGIICAPTVSGVCAAPGYRCAAPSAEPFSKQCIGRPGFFGCPQPYTDRHELGDPTAVKDSRACTGCSCTDPSDFSCEVAFTFFENSDCTGASFPMKADNGCEVPATGGVTATSYKAAYSFTGTCSASGGQPVGGVSSLSPVTVCCLP